MAAAIGEAKERGFSELLLWTPCGAKRARAFYEREGFALTGAEHGTSPSGLMTVQYARPLRDGA
jgi:hypothetical protein